MKFFGWYYVIMKNIDADHILGLKQENGGFILGVVHKWCPVMGGGGGKNLFFCGPHCQTTPYLN